MSQSERTRAARIRAKATGRKYQQALESFDGEPSPAQRELEGLFFGQLESFWYEPELVRASTSGIVGVNPHFESLTIYVGENAQTGDLRDRILPSFVDDAMPEAPFDVEVWGIPGLRTRAHKLGTSCYRPGLAAEVVLADIRPDDLKPVAHGDLTWAGTECPDDWTKQETLFAKKYALNSGLDISSAILRRLGLIRASGTWSAHTWKALGPIDVAIELSFDKKVTRQQAEELRDDLLSKYLSPQLVLDRYKAPHEHSGGSILLSVPITGQSVELRLEHRSRSVRSHRPISPQAGADIKNAKSAREVESAPQMHREATRGSS